MTTGWTRQHILSLADFTPAEYDSVLQTAEGFRKVLTTRTKKVPALQGAVVANLFFEPSTRTRSSFELAAKRLSADTLNFATSSSSLAKGETILDTAKTYVAMGATIVVVRHNRAGVPAAIARELDRLNAGVSAINAGDGQHEHPSQALLDLFSLYTLRASEAPREFLRGRKVAIVGDIVHSRVARSNIYSLTAMGAEVHLAGPPTLLPREFLDLLDASRSQQVFLHRAVEPAIDGADYVMALRLQRERMSANLLPSLREYRRDYGLGRDRLRLASPQVKVLHPGPVNRGVELSSEAVDDLESSLILDQVTSGVAVRMALLFLVGTGKLTEPI
ncbi:aspartate carbamoyltransferase [Rubidibacter lacunae KORDI 51-2]|uniref:Aspartate carbamoyltransferase n=1 Tax=Rubidibacter lacunae KORDI 51-2 TaxID=582515 RepID=U5D9K9_9CHRO|nr:aspartate carbamoyltransferase catalytic subunit [Rubidibacter lacunae]ERN41278.1 aspartate carbamoyltransferase [Rubidibacter lacunae KORDI 51-2]